MTAARRHIAQCPDAGPGIIAVTLRAGIVRDIGKAIWDQIADLNACRAARSVIGDGQDKIQCFARRGVGGGLSICCAKGGFG